MPFIEFPNVPNVAGVPAILRSATVPTPQALEVGALGAITSLLGFGPPVWGVFDLSGNQVLVPDSFLALDYKNDARVSDYPQEQGAFASYNKVQTPYDVRTRMTIGADLASRAAFLAQCDAMLKSTDTFNVVTPEVTYFNATVENFAYRRETKNGATLITVDLWFLEVRVSATAQFSAAASSSPLAANQVKAPNAADPISDGQVQAADPTAARAAALQKIATQNGLTVITTPITQ
jgi:hypothetical protein